MEALAQGSVVAERYVVHGEIGRGSSAVVYLARDRESDSDVAIKIMSPSYAVDGEARARFLREARVTSGLVHEGTARVLDYGDDDGMLYITMPALDGMSLRQYLADHTLTISEIVAIGSQVANVLVAAHAVGLVHRDLKPENIFVLSSSAEAGTPVICVVDFGLAFLTSHDGSLGRLTQDGILGGTPAYMSPEQAQADPLTASTDIYSLGCVLYELVAGTPPFVGNIPETLARHIYVAPVSLASRELAIDPPEALCELIGEMLSKPETSRPTSEVVVERLAAIASGR